MTYRRISPRWVGALSVALLTTAVLPAQVPQGLSPGSATAPSRVFSSCPTFSWSASDGASGYELVVYRLAEKGTLEEQTRVRLPRGGSWTPAAEECPAAAGEYAWAVRALSEEGTGAWSEPLLFSTPGTPLVDEVRQALETLRRYETAKGRHPVGSQRTAAEVRRVAPDGVRTGLQEDREREGASPAPTKPDASPLASGPLRTPTLSSAPSPRAVVTPGSFSLSLAGDVDLGGFLFKEGYSFIHNEGGVAFDNTAVGLHALESVTPGSPYSTSGAQNSAFGRGALRFNTSGRWNTATGYGALSDNTSGVFNTAHGARALGISDTSNYNTAVGALALGINRTGAYNTAIGFDALYSNDTGSFNTASGSRALFQNTTGQRNTASGFQALLSNTTGTRNTATGFKALFNNTTGQKNTAAGDRALYHNFDGYRNTVSGYTTMFHNTTGFNNTATGYRALFQNTEGYDSTAMGYSALRENTTGKGNTAIGYGALRSNDTGAFNTAVGRNAGLSWTTGNSNIAIGDGAYGVAGESNTIRIGGYQDTTYIDGIHGATVPGGTQVLITSDNRLGTSTSSARFKQDIRDLEAITDRLQDLRPVSFRYKGELARGGPNPLEYGLIAEEVAQIFPELVVYDDDGKPYTVRYHVLIPLLLGEVQRQEKELARLRSPEVSTRPELRSRSRSRNDSPGGF